MVLDSIIMIGTTIMLVIALLAVGSYIIALLTPVAPDLFLGVPQIGAVNCDPPTPGTPTPAFIFGKPGYATMGCVHSYMIIAAFSVVAFVFAIGFALVYFKNALNGSEGIMQMVKYMGSSLIILIFIPTFHIIYDGAAGIITSSATWIAAIPQGPARDYEQLKHFAGIDIMTPFDKMRDPMVAKHECIIPVDVDGDGQIDRYDMNYLCLIGTSFLTPEFFQTIMIFTIGNMIGIMTTLVIFVAVVIKYLLTGVLAVAFPLLLALSKLPKIGDIFDEWLKAFYGLLAAPLLLALVAAVAPVVIIGALNTFHETGGASADAEKYIAFIMFVAMAYTYLAVIIGCARILGSVIMSASTVVMGAAMAGFGAAMATARAGGTAALGSTMGPGAAAAFSNGFSMMPGAGGAGQVMGFAKNGKEVEAGAPANDMVSSATNASTGSTSAPATASTWSGPTESDASPTTTNIVSPAASQVNPPPTGIGAFGRMGGAVVMPWGRAIEQSAVAVHPSAKTAASMRKDNDKIDNLWPLHREKPIEQLDEKATDGQLPDNSDYTDTETNSNSSNQ